jgi:hypothetical protein
MKEQTPTKLRTKQAKSEGSERNGPRERISGSERVTIVRRFTREWAQTLGNSVGKERVRENL